MPWRLRRCRARVRALAAQRRERTWRLLLRSGAMLGVAAVASSMVGATRCSRYHPDLNAFGVADSRGWRRYRSLDYQDTASQRRRGKDALYVISDLRPRLLHFAGASPERKLSRFHGSDERRSIGN